MLHGCVGVTEESARQLGEIGPVEVTTVICASQGREPTCPLGNSSQPAGSGEFQLLVGYRIPTQVTPPESVATRDGDLSMSRNLSFESELARLAPPPRGRRWAGYVSPAFEFSALFGERSAELVGLFSPLRGADGGAFGGPFAWRTVVGFREAAPDDQRPVRCGDAVGEPGDDGSTLCHDWPSPEELGEEMSLSTRDVGVLSGSRGSARRGGTGSVPFTINYTGPAPSLGLSAETSVPGGAAAPATLHLTPQGPQTVPVSVSVPATTPPGTYEVRLTATMPGGEQRSGTGQITVTGSDPIDGTAPEIGLRLRGSTRISRVRHLGVTVEVNCSEPCRLRGELRIGRASARRIGIRTNAQVVTVGRFSERRLAHGRRNLRVRIARRYFPFVRRARRVPVTMRVIVRDAAGNAKARGLRLTLRR